MLERNKDKLSKILIRKLQIGRRKGQNTKINDKGKIIILISGTKKRLQIILRKLREEKL